VIDDEADETSQAWTEGYDEGYEAALDHVLVESRRMFRLDKPQQARFEWVLKRVKEEAGLTL